MFRQLRISELLPWLKICPYTLAQIAQPRNNRNKQTFITFQEPQDLKKLKKQRTSRTVTFKAAETPFVYTGRKEC